MAEDTVFVLVAHGSREPAWAEPLVRLAHGTGARLAFVEMGTPSIEEAVTEALAEGARTVKLLPLFMAVGRHVKRDIPGSVETLRAKYPERNIEILPALGENERFWEALREIVRDQMGTAGAADGGTPPRQPTPSRFPSSAGGRSPWVAQSSSEVSMDPLSDPSDDGVTRRR